jgi:hypothetical protein
MLRIETTFRALRKGDRFTSDIDTKSIEVDLIETDRRCGVHINGESCYEWDYPILILAVGEVPLSQRKELRQWRPTSPAMHEQDTTQHASVESALRLLFPTIPKSSSV